jgi:uncharacterized protein (DUF983 family)
MPQFATAEYAHLPQTETCAMCGQLFGESYYRVQEKKVCSACAERVQATFPQDSHTAFTRGLLLGIGAAIVALAVYAGFTIVTHIYLGYLALGVGWFIAKAMLMGSGGVGGRRYQITAVLLTYAAISLAAIPILLHQILQSPKIHNGTGVMLGVLIHFWPRLLWYGIASPFLELSQLVQGLLGLFILFIGLRIAWQMTRTRGVAIDGPFPVA